jgi:hypothetical protein
MITCVRKVYPGKKLLYILCAITYVGVLSLEVIQLSWYSFDVWLDPRFVTLVSRVIGVTVD